MKITKLLSMLIATTIVVSCLVSCPSAYMEDASNENENTEVGTSILYFYQNETEKDAVWAGSERSLTYRNK